jgi:hypothetical protein
MQLLYNYNFSLIILTAKSKYILASSLLWKIPLCRRSMWISLSFICSSQRIIVLFQQSFCAITLFWVWNIFSTLLCAANSLLVKMYLSWLKKAGWYSRLEGVTCSM